MKSLLTISFLLLPFFLSADTLTLEQVLAKTLNGNLPVQIAGLRTEQAAVNNSPGAAGMLPSVDASAGITKRIENSRQQFYTGDDRVFDNAKSTQQNAGINGTWTLFDGLGMFALKDKLEELEKFAGLEARLVTESALASAVITYYQISLAGQQVEVMDSVLLYSQERSVYAREGWLTGAGSELEYLQSRVDLTADSLAVENALVQVKNLKAELNRIMGHSVDSTFIVSQVIPPAGLLNYAELIENARSGNSEVILARTAVGITALEVKEARAGRLPTINGIAGYNYSKSASEAGFLQSSQVIGPQVGLNLQYNLFNGGAVNRAVKVAELDTRIRNMDLKLALLELDEMVYKTFNQYILARTRVEAERQSFELSQRNARIGRASYQAGAISFLQFREIQEQYLQAGSSYYNALFEAKRNEVLLLQLSGRLID